MLRSSWRRGIQISFPSYSVMNGGIFLKKLQKLPFFCFAVLFCTWLCACQSIPPTPDFSAVDFTADVCFSLGEQTYRMVYTKANGTKSLQLQAPESLADMVIRQSGGEVRVTVGALAYTVAAAEGMFAFTELFEPPNGCLDFSGQEDGLYCFSGSAGEDRYTLYTDESGLPTRLCGAIDGREYDIQILRFITQKGE